VSPAGKFFIGQGMVGGNEMKVLVDPRRNHVLLQGDSFEARLTWSAALNLGTLLIEKSAQAEPPAGVGKTFSTKESR
jgi:hypothetical protein